MVGMFPELHVPPERIARVPLPGRSDSMMLVVDRRGGRLRDTHVHRLPDYLDPGDLLVFNDSRVIAARLFGIKPTGGKVEILIERVTDERVAQAMVSTSKPVRPGLQVAINDNFSAEVDARDDEGFWTVRFNAPVSEVLRASGEVPLPPYMERAPTGADTERYQTIYAQAPGSVAAPTAGLHFDDALFSALADRGVESAFVTLHVGAGTFIPLRTNDLDAHVMHAERYEIPPETVAAVTACRERGSRVYAIGTTSVRCLESAARNGQLAPGTGETRLFIRDGFRFQVVDGLLTNFHLPDSTLIVLVAALLGRDLTVRAYRHALAESYRFYSYGDAMLILAPDTAYVPA